MALLTVTPAVAEPESARGRDRTPSAVASTELAGDPEILFDDGFESGQLDGWPISTEFTVRQATPREGTVGTEVVINGLGFRTPTVRFSNGGITGRFEVLEVDFDRITARLLVTPPAGQYTLRVDEPLPLFDSGADLSFDVRSATDLDVSPTFVTLGAQATLSAGFLGTTEGTVALRSRSAPGAQLQEVSILEWNGTADGSPGEVLFTVPFDLPNNGPYDVIVATEAGTSLLPAGLVLTGLADEDTQGIQVVAAVATSPTEVLVQFNEAVEGGPLGAENPLVYRVTAPARVPTLNILSAELLPPTYSTARLTTLEQSDLFYTVTVSNVRDLAGNSFVPPSLGNPNPNTASFWGVPPGTPSNTDSDGDGLLDRDEQVGWWVHWRRLDGSTASRHVTSNPGDPRLDPSDPVNVAARDTDADGLDDLGEKQANTDPRSVDTDADGLGDNDEWNVVYSDPLDQDSDRDGATDGIEVTTFRTSPILADTDGDQLLDLDEVVAGNRNPLVADLPAPQIRVGSVDLTLDTRFERTDENGQQTTESKQSTASLQRSEETTYATSDERSTLETLETSQSISASVGVAIPPDVSIEASFSASQGSEQGSTFTVDESSGRASEESYEDSLSVEGTVDVRETITRTVEGAAVKVDVTLESTGDVPFTISNLELTAQTQNPSNRRQLLPVASLVPENPELDAINIGALGDPARGPFVFTAISVFPQQVEELMKNPRGLLVSLANFDITDESGRNFSFISQDVLDRTAGLTFDLGDGRVESYRVATASVHDPQTGRPVGITLRYAFEGILGLYGVPTLRDGGDGLASAVATGDDVQRVAPGEAVEPGDVVVTAGPDGILDSNPAGDDGVTPADYATARPQGNQILDGGDGIADTLAAGDDVQEIAVGDPVEAGGVVVTAGPDGELDSMPMGDDGVAPESGAVLTRFRDVATGLVDDPTTDGIDERRRFWVLYTSKDIADHTDLGDMVLRAGDELNFAFVQDQDDDEVMAREEFLHGSSDRMANTDGCPLGDPCIAGSIEARTDTLSWDTLSDAEEIQIGWRVQLAQSPQAFLVYPRPTQGDSDRDFLADHEERACGLDPRQRDTDLDGLSDWEELTGQLQGDGGIFPMTSRDPDTDLPVHTIVPYSGEGEGDLIFHETFPDCDALFTAPDSTPGFATDPLNPDTDGDGVSDFAELGLGIHPNNPEDGGDFLDDDGDGIPNNRERGGFNVGVNCGSTVPMNCIQTFTSNPNDPDTDGDTLPDLLEHFIGSNPRALDTDGDGLADNDEYRGQGETCLTVIPGEPCVPFSDLIGGEFLDFVAECGAAPGCTYDEGTLLAGRDQYGTNLNESDTDFDGVDDAVELLDPLTITVDGAQQILPAPVSDPFLQDTDGEGIGDFEEFLGLTNPRLADTDTDGVDDRREGDLGTNPIVRDRRVSFRWESLILTFCDDGTFDDECEFEGSWSIQTQSGTEVILTAIPEELITGIDYEVSVGRDLFTYPTYVPRPDGPLSRDYTLLANDTIRVFSTGVVEYDDGSGNDEVDELDRTFTLTCDGFGCTLDTLGTVILEQKDPGEDDATLESTLNLTLQE